MDAPARISTLGRLDLVGPDGAPIRSVLSQPKRLALLVYVATAPGGVRRRDHLLALFWPELDEDQAVHRLRRSLGDGVLTSDGGDDLRVDAGRLWCDAVALEGAVGVGRDSEGVELYRGAFLDGLRVDGAAPEFEHWVDRQRSRFRELATAAVWRVVEAEERRGNGAGAVRWAIRASEIAPTDEASVSRLIDLLARQGDTAGAVRAYDEHLRALRELDLEPSAGLREAAEALRSAPPARRHIPIQPEPVTAANPEPRARTRLIVLPFRLLRPDPETEFLAFSLPDAITSSLAGLRALVVRSNLAAERFARETPDLRVIATEADVDVILTGTLLRVGEQLRVTCQLTDADDGRLLWSERSQVALGDLFTLQDDLAHRIVDSLALPLSDRERRKLSHNVPGSARAYEFYLRANQVAYEVGQWTTARDLYQTSIDEDPEYAPAWARLARCYRLIAKWSVDEAVRARNLQAAEFAFRRALEIDPELPAAHNLYAQLEVDLGRARDAMVRLLRHHHAGNEDAELFAGLLHSCRFCGLLDASLAAHQRARDLDPGITTSVSHTHFMRGDYARVLEDTYGDIGYIEPLALATLGRTAEALALLRDRVASSRPGGVGPYIQSLLATLEGDRIRARRACEQAFTGLQDAEARFYLVRQLAHIGERDWALEELERVVISGFHCVPPLRSDPWLDPLRSRPAFAAVLARAEDYQRLSRDAFQAAGGEEVLGAASPVLLPGG
jgi:TolB-like protein/DNA-binding SARP family transcriptional activator